MKKSISYIQKITRPVYKNALPDDPYKAIVVLRDVLTGYPVDHPERDKIEIQIKNQEGRK